MEYRKLSECMTEKEVETLMEVLLTGSKVKELSRLEDSNCINVTFEYEGREEILIFYPDDVDNVPEGIVLDNETFYQIYMIMNGYSRIWEKEPDLKIAKWIAAARKTIGDRQEEQKDSIVKELLKESRSALRALEKELEGSVELEKLHYYQQINEQAVERLEHISYVQGFADAVTMLRLIDKKVNLPDIASDMEELVEDYNNLYGLVETFGDGATMQLGDYDVTKGIYAIAVSLMELNIRLNNFFEKIIGKDE